MVSYDLCNSPWNDKKKSPCTHNCVPCEKFCSFYTALKHSVNFFQPVKTSFLTFNIYYTTINGDKQEELLTVMYYSITKYLLESSSLTCSAGSYLGPAQFDLITKAKQKKKKAMLPSSLINTCKSVAASFLEVWLESAVIVYSEAGCVGWRGRVCGSPTGRLFQVSLAKFKWLGPSPTPQMGSVSAGLPTLLELRLQQVCCAVSVGKEIVFSTCTCTFKQALRRKKKRWQGRVYICRCLPGGGLQSLLQWWPFDIPSSSHDATVASVRRNFFYDL